MATKPQAWKNPDTTRETPAARLKVMSRVPGAVFTVQTPYQLSLDCEDDGAFIEATTRAIAAAKIIGLNLGIIDNGRHAVLTLTKEVCAWCPAVPGAPKETGPHISHSICPECVTALGV